MNGQLLQHQQQQQFAISHVKATSSSARHSQSFMLRGMPHLAATAASALASCLLFMTTTRDAREMLLLQLLWGLTKHIMFICNINQTVRIIYTHLFVIDPSASAS